MKKYLTIIFGVALIPLFGLQSCKTSEEIAGEQPVDEVKIESIVTKEIAKGNLHGFGAEGIEMGGMVINSQEKWEAVTQKMNSVNQAVAPKSIDFEQRTVIAYFDKIRGSGGHAVTIESVNKINNNYTVTISKTSPDGPAIEIMTQPFYIVSIPKYLGAVVFKEPTE